MNIDTSDFRRLSAALAVSAAVLPIEARKVVAKGALNIKNDARKRVSTHPTWRKLAPTINYDLAGSNAAQAVATVGYNDVGQGELAGIAEFGSARHAPHPALMPAAEAEAPNFEKAMLDVIDSIKKAL